MKERHAGFSLIELLVVILLIGIITALGVPSYQKTMESNKAEDAASMTNMIAMANRQYAQDHQGIYTATPSGGELTNSCNTAGCQGNGAACDLVACHYIAPMDFDHYSYNLATLPLGGPGACYQCGSQVNLVGCSWRRVSGANSTTTAPYNVWGYAVDRNGTIYPCGGAPAPTQ